MSKNSSIYIIRFTFLLTLTYCLLSCGKESVVPKPRGYYRIDTEEKSYRIFDSVGFPYKFQYPVYATIVPVEKKGEVYWLNLTFPAYNATVYLSYKPLRKNLSELTEDSHKLSYKHVIKADAITESVITRKDANVYGLLMEVDGDAASPAQFYLTDSTANFLYGSLYFNTTPNADSLAPLITYIKQDIEQLIKTTEWKKK